MDTCNFSDYIQFYRCIYYEILSGPLLLTWYPLLIIVALVYFLFIVISIVWLIVLGKRYRKMKKQLSKELNINSDSEEYSEEYFQLQSKRKALLLFILIIAVELIIGIILILPIMCASAFVSIVLYSVLPMSNSLNHTTPGYSTAATSTSVLTFSLIYTYCLSLLLRFGAFTFHTLTLAAIVQFYINIYASRRDTVPLRKYLIPATLQFLSIILLCPFIVTAPIITLLMFIYYPIDLYFLIRNSRRLKHLLVVRRNEAALIGPEMLKEHESHLKYFKRIWGSFMISFVICIVSLIIQSIFASVIIVIFPFLYLDFEIMFKIFPTFDIIWIVTSFGYFQFLLYTIVSSIMYASVYLYKIVKPCCKPRENELRPLLDEYRNDVLARNALNNNQEDAPINFENNYIASTFFAK